MKTKRLLFAISIISFVTILFTSCTEDGNMGIGETGGGGTPPPPSMTKSVNTFQADTISATPYLPND